MIYLDEDLYIKCDECGTENTVDANSIEYEVFSEERNMGESTEYNYFGEICCVECGNKITFSVRGYEYPIGALDYSDEECYGGEFVKIPLLEMEYGDYEFDNRYTEYIYEECLSADELLEKESTRIQLMSPIEFENYVANIFMNLGFIVKVTKRTRDGGFDIIATKEEPIPFTVIAECKHWTTNKVDVKVVRSVYGVQNAMRANKAVVVTSSKFTRDARRFAENQQELMTLWDIDDLLRITQDKQRD